MGINFSFAITILVLALIGVAYAAYRGTVPSIPRTYRMALMSLRVIVFVFVGLLLMDPRWIHQSERTEPATAIALIDRSASMGLPAARDQGDRPRSDEADRLARELEREVRSRGGRFQEAFFSADLLTAGGDTTDAGGQGTDIEKSLSTLYGKYEGENLGAIVILSDGVDTERRLVRGVKLPVPVYTIGLGDTTEPEDVRIEDVDYNSIVRAPSRSTITATIRHTGAENKPVEVRLSEGGRTLFRRDTLLTTGVREVAVDIPVSFPEAGRRSFDLDVVTRGDDTQAENNRRDIVIDAEKSGVKILIVDLTPDWELHFLTEFLRKDQTFDFDLVSSLGERVSRGERVLRTTEFENKLANYDALIVSSVDESFLNDRVAAAIKRFVVDEGKGLLILPGPSSLFEHRAAWARLADILPIRNEGPPRFTLQFTSVRPGAQAGTNPITSQLVPLLSQSDWQQRSPLLGYYASLTPKSGVEVLLETDARRAPAFVYHAAGKGRVALLGVGPLWRWKFLGGSNSLYDEIVSRLLDVLSRGEATERFLLTSRKNVYDSGQEAVITAELFNKKMQPVTGVPVKIELIRIGDGGEEIPLRMIAMQREGSDNPRFRSVLPPLPPGNYRINGTAELPERVVHAQAIDITVSEVSVEYQRVSQDHGNLLRIAAQSGGRFVAPASMVDFARSLPLESRVVRSTRELSLRTSAIVFGLLLLLLIVEWVVRKRAGMI